MLGLSGTGAVVNLFTFGGNGLLCERINGVDGFLTFDPSGNTVQSLSPTQSVNYSHLVTGFGSQLVGGSTSDAYDGLGAQWGYRRESGNLFLLGHRYYSSQRGQFLTRDPIGYGGGVNLYGYTANNPVNRRDSSGYQSSLETAQGIDEQLMMLEEGEGDWIGLPKDEIYKDIGKFLENKGIKPKVFADGERHIVGRAISRCGSNPIKTLLNVFRNGTGFYDNAAGDYKLYLASRHLALVINEDGEAVTVLNNVKMGKDWEAVGRDFLPEQYR